jgi:TRAP-type mannitol/chloroaromatic compound transport system permease small subunit
MMWVVVVCVLITTKQKNAHLKEDLIQNSQVQNLLLSILTNLFLPFCLYLIVLDETAW